jgi:hypothetical protein
LLEDSLPQASASSDTPNSGQRLLTAADARMTEQFPSIGFLIGILRDCGEQASTAPA